jgi:AraC-like DNA-binding protein
MNSTVAADVARLQDMSVSQLARRFEEVFGEQCRSRHRRYLIRRIAWRLQANSEGGLTERARRGAEKLPAEAEMRVTPPRARTPKAGAPPDTTKTQPARDPRLPPPGNWIERDYKGTMIRVLVVADGFEYEGRRYRSLSAIAKAITGSHINGFLFFRLWRKP